MLRMMGLMVIASREAHVAVHKPSIYAGAKVFGQWPADWVFRCTLLYFVLVLRNCEKKNKRNLPAACDLDRMRKYQ